MKTKFVCLTAFLTSLVSVSAMASSAYVATTGQQHVIRASIFQGGSCRYVNFEKCDLGLETVGKETDLSVTPMTCTPLFDHIESISVSLLPALEFRERVTAANKTAQVATAVFPANANILLLSSTPRGLDIINPFFNTAVIKMLKTRPGQTVRMINTEDLIRQAPAIQASFGDIESQVSQSTGCPATLLN